MIFAIDAGNTNIVLGLFDEDEKLAFTARLNTHAYQTEDELAVVFMDIFRLYGVDARDVGGAVVSCVVPMLTAPICRAAEKLCSCKAVLVAAGVKTELIIRIDDPKSIGSDLICGVVAAKEKYPLPCIVIDLGTATKIMLLDKSGAMAGGVIIPGVKISLDALSARTAALPQISAEGISRVIGTNTVDSMRSGILNGTAAMLDGMAERFEQELGEGECSVVMTGGYAGLIMPYCRRKAEFDENLLLKGLLKIYRLNQK